MVYNFVCQKAICNTKDISYIIMKKEETTSTSCGVANIATI